MPSSSALGERHARWAGLRAAGHDQGRELAVLQWTADFVADGERHAEAMATPWFPVNYEANAALSEEMRTVPDAFHAALTDFLG